MAEQRAVVSPARHCSLLMGKGSSLALLTRNMGFSKVSDEGYIRNMKRMHFLVARVPKNTTSADLRLDIVKISCSWRF